MLTLAWCLINNWAVSVAACLAVIWSGDFRKFVEILMSAPFSMSIIAICVLFIAHAKCRGVRPISFSFVLTFVVLLRRIIFVISTKPFSTERCKGVSPCLSFSVTSAPRWSNNLIMSVLLYCNARCSKLFPLVSVEFTSPPLSRRYSITFALFLSKVKCKGANPEVSLTLIAAPFSTSNCTPLTRSLSTILCSKVIPVFLDKVSLTSAPFSINIFADTMLLYRRAVCRGVFPSLFLAWISTPSSRRSWNIVDNSHVMHLRLYSACFHFIFIWNEGSVIGSLSAKSLKIGESILNISQKLILASVGVQYYFFQSKLEKNLCLFVNPPTCHQYRLFYRSQGQMIPCIVYDLDILSCGMYCCTSIQYTIKIRTHKKLMQLS